KSGDLELMGIILYRKALVLKYTSGEKETLDIFFEAEKAFEKTGNLKRLSDCESAISDFYQNNLSNYQRAMEYCLKAMKLEDDMNLEASYIDNLMSLAGLYSLIGDHANALEQLKLAEAKLKQTNGSRNQYYSLENSLGEDYRLSGKYPEAIRAYNLAIQYNP